MPNFTARNVLVLGYGASGRAAAELCLALKAAVNVADEASLLGVADELPVRHLLGRPLAELAPGVLDGVDLVVRSPGVPDDLPILRTARSRGVPVRSEIDLAAGLCPCPVIAVTGTNGKSTTTVLIGQLLSAAGQRVHVVGNIGLPFSSQLSLMRPADVAVVEVSAAQLQNTHRLAPAVSVLTNIRPEHQDLYSWDEYTALKARLLANNTDESLTVTNHADPHCRAIAEQSAGRVTYLVAFGDTAPQLITTAHQAGFTTCLWAPDLAAALASARGLAQPGGAVLFSPGTYSKDLVPDYLERGLWFKHLTRALPGFRGAPWVVFGGRGSRAPASGP